MFLAYKLVPFDSSDRVCSVAMDLKIHVVLLCFRLSNAALCKTSFDPDEYWQALEVAHRRVFGYGYLTWEWHTQLRSYIFPLAFELMYRVISLFECRHFSRFLLLICPRLLMAVLAHLTDVYSFKTCRLLFGRTTALICLYLQVASWFLFYAITRTFINCLETLLLVLAFYVFCRLLLSGNGTKECQIRFVLLLALIGLVCYLRPTAAPSIALYLIALLFSPLGAFHKIILSVGTTAVVSSILFLTEAYLYGEFALPLFNFLNLNVVSGVASLYGTHPLHWYLTQCLPVLLLANTPAFVVGTVLTVKNNRPPIKPTKVARLALPILLLINLALLSPVPHKEFRYFLPMLPFCHMLAAVGISSTGKTQKRRFLSLCRKVMILLPLTQLPLSFYFGFVHQRGTIRVMDFLYGHTTEVDRVLFLMPCHSTPLYSHIHTNATLHFLECSPPNYEPLDRAALFYRDVIPRTDTLLSDALGYSYVVCFSVLSDQIGSLLAERGFAKKVQLFHTHLPEGRVGSHVHVYKYVGL